MESPEEEAEAEVDVTAGASFTLHVNFKIFARAILTLNRVGNELYMEPSDFGLILRSLSCSKSAFGTFMFSKSFFSECDVLRIDPNAYNVCRIPMKCALSAFKCVKNSEKAVLSCQLHLNPRADTMLIQLTHTYDRDMVMKTEGKIPVAEFQKYSIQRPAEITVNLKELKAIVNFADVHQSLVSIYFDHPGTPIVIALEGDVNYTAEVILATAVDDPAGHDVNSEVPVEIVHALAEEGQLKRKRSHSSLNPKMSGNLVADCAMARKRIIESSSARSNDANEALSGAGNIDFVIGPPKATSSPIRFYSEVRLGKETEDGTLTENGKLHDKSMDTGDNVAETSRKNTNVYDVKICGSESPPSRGPALFRYLFSLDEPTFDSAEFSRDAEVLASDSDPETSDPHPEQYIFDSDSEPNTS